MTKQLIYSKNYYSYVKGLDNLIHNYLGHENSNGEKDETILLWQLFEIKLNSKSTIFNFKTNELEINDNYKIIPLLFTHYKWSKTIIDNKNTKYTNAKYIQIYYEKIHKELLNLEQSDIESKNIFIRQLIPLKKIKVIGIFVFNQNNNYLTIPKTIQSSYSKFIFLNIDKPVKVINLFKNIKTGLSSPYKTDVKIVTEAPKPFDTTFELNYIFSLLDKMNYVFNICYTKKEKKNLFFK
jgi:hypothetical protein